VSFSQNEVLLTKPNGRKTLSELIILARRYKIEIEQIQVEDVCCFKIRYLRAPCVILFQSRKGFQNTSQLFLTHTMKLVHTHFLSYYQREFELKRCFILLHIFYLLLLDTEVSEFVFYTYNLFCFSAK
jgi:hypothetical protein